MGELALIILNAIIIFFLLKVLIKTTRKKMQNCNTNKWIGSKQKRRSQIGGFLLVLSIINLWLTTSGKFRIISFIIFIVMVVFIVFMGALTEG